MLAAVLTLGAATGCTTVVTGRGQVNPLGHTVRGDSGDEFDSEVKASLADIITYWKATYPKIANGAALPPLRGGYYSVDGDSVVSSHTVPASARGNKCLERKAAFIVDNAAYCQLDDSIVWDRGANHLLPVLTAQYGPALTALVFAHEFGHAIQHRLHIDDTAGVSTIDIESQADCAAGAFAATALAGKAPHVPMTAADLDRALDGYFQIRDSTPDTPADATHGNGFDRLNALQLGIEHGASFCFSPSYLHDRRYTERGYVDARDYNNQGNQPLATVLSAKGIAPDLNRFWRAAGSHARTELSQRAARAGRPPSGAAAPTRPASSGTAPTTTPSTTARPSPSVRTTASPTSWSTRTPPTCASVPGQPGDYALGIPARRGLGHGRAGAVLPRRPRPTRAR